MNYIIAILNIVLGVYFIQSTFKKPAPLFSTNLKGYLAGIGFISIGLMAIFGNLNLIKIYNGIWNAF
ncbi:MAG: hypothetical protein RL607_1276 [Bacteroidota bacterium]|jgi:hypothetical protein